TIAHTPATRPGPLRTPAPIAAAHRPLSAPTRPRARLRPGAAPMREATPARSSPHRPAGVRLRPGPQGLRGPGVRLRHRTHRRAQVPDARRQGLRPSARRLLGTGGTRMHGVDDNVATLAVHVAVRPLGTVFSGYLRHVAQLGRD